MKTIFYLFTATLIVWGCESLIFEEDSYDYSIEQQMGCFCPQGGVWVKLFVTSDTIFQAIRVSDEYKLTYDEFKYYKSIKGLFGEISEIDTAFYNIEVAMDSINNYPNYIRFDPKPIIVNGDTVSVVADAWSSYTTKNYIKLR